MIPVVLSHPCRAQLLQNPQVNSENVIVLDTRNSIFVVKPPGAISIGFLDAFQEWQVIVTALTKPITPVTDGEKAWKMSGPR